MKQINPSCGMLLKKGKRVLPKWRVAAVDAILNCYLLMPQVCAYVSSIITRVLRRVSFLKIFFFCFSKTQGLCLYYSLPLDLLPRTQVDWNLSISARYVILRLIDVYLLYRWCYRKHGRKLGRAIVISLNNQLREAKHSYGYGCHESNDWYANKRHKT